MWRRPEIASFQVRKRRHPPNHHHHEKIPIYDGSHQQDSSDQEMDDDEVCRVASNNPALTPATSQRLSLHRHRSHPHLSRVPARKGVINEDTDSEDKKQFSTPDLNQDSHSVLSYASSSKYDVGWRRIVANFTPSWFSVTMGTGMVALLFKALPFDSIVLYWISVFFFCLNCFLFTLAFVTSILRYILYPEIWPVMIADDTNSLFLGTIPMGFATIVQGWVKLCVPYWGEWSVTVGWAAWIIDAVVSVAVTISLSIILMTTPNPQALHRITAAQLLPIAATVVASGAGTAVVPYLPPDRALGTIIACYVMWGMSTPLALAVLVMYYQRLALHKLPPREVVVSSFLPLGPMGMGGFAIMRLGTVSRIVFPQTEFFQSQGITIAGDVFYVLGAFTSLIMWAFGLTWLCFALASIYLSRPFPFNMGWWGFTFPFGAYAISTIEFGVQMPSLFFRVVGILFAVCVILLWCVVAAGTIRGMVDGRLFIAPCLSSLRTKRQQNEVRPTDSGILEKEVCAGDEHKE